MTVSIEVCTEQRSSVSQLLRSAKVKLQGIGFGVRTAMIFNEAEVNALEQDAFEVLSLVWSLKNTFAPINKTPADVLTMIPDYWDERIRDQNLITLTHVCRGWRDIFTSCPSLWARLDCTNVRKTRVYLERSKSSPLEIHIGDSSEAASYLVPHIGRLKTLYAHTTSGSIPPALVRHFSCRLPLLEKLTIKSLYGRLPPLPEELFGGDLSSLRELSLGPGVPTPLPWKDMWNLTTLTLDRMAEYDFPLTQLLNFFESAPHIRYIYIHNSIPYSSDAPAQRVVSLTHLKKLKITSQPVHSTLLNHLSIPAGASLTLEFSCGRVESPIHSYLPKSSDGLLNLSHITTVNLSFGPCRRFLRLHGPSGELRVLGGRQRCENATYNMVDQFLWSLGRFDLSRSRRLVIQQCHVRSPSPGSIAECATYQTLDSLKDLYSLTLIQCGNLPFFLILDPDTNPPTTVLCPKLKEITLYIKGPDDLPVDELLKMAEERASRGARLSVITIVSTGTLAPEKDVFQLRKHVSRVKCKFEDAPPEWDTLPGQVV